jgi:hypothetical protein
MITTEPDTSKGTAIIHLKVVIMLTLPSDPSLAYQMLYCVHD